MQDLPKEIIEQVVCRAVAHEPPIVSARQLALLELVDKTFNTIAKSELHRQQQHKPGRDTARESIEHLARHAPPDEFAAGMRALVANTPNVGLRLQSLPDHLRETALEVLAEQTHLQSLELDASHSPDMARRAVEVMQAMLPANREMRLAELNLNSCGLTHDDVLAIANSPGMRSLNSLNVGRNDIRDEGLMALANSEHLRLWKLDLTQNRISDRGVTALANSESARKLFALDLSNNARIGARGLAALANSEKLAALEGLGIANNGIGDDGVAALANGRHWKLRTLVLGGNQISNTGIAALANGMSARTLTSLNLQSNTRIDARGVAALAKSDNLRSLTSLKLDGNPSVGMRGAFALARSSHLRLRTLDLGGCRIGNIGLIALANSRMAGSLTSLRLRQNNITQAGLRFVAGSARLSNLTELNLEDNRLNAGGAKTLANNRHLRSLKSLNVSRNDIRNAGVTALANSPVARSLTVLAAGYNHIDNDGAVAIAESDNLTSLKVLNLICNEIRDDGARSLANSDRLAADLRLHMFGNLLRNEGLRALRNRFSQVRL